MKSIIPSILVLAAIVCFTSCKNEKKEETPPPVQTEIPTTPAASDIQVNPTPAQASPEPAQNALGVWHFTCPKGCAGGGGAQGPCPKCGGPLQHNPAYHTK